MSNSTLSDNNTLGEGGGIYQEWGSDTIFDNVAITGNTADTDGGGVCLDGSESTMTNVTLAGNHAVGLGGGLYTPIALFSSYADMENVSVVENTADGDGGGLALTNGFLLMNQVTLSDNAALGNGGGVFVDGGGVWSTYSNVWNNSPDDYYGVTDPTGVDGNISTAPLFLDTTPIDPLEWDLHLDPASSLVDAGDLVNLDPDGGTADIGAYGGTGAALWDLDRDSYYEWWLPGPYDAATSPGLDCNDLDDSIYPGSGC